MQEIITAITTVGFPIIAYLLLFHSLRSDLKSLTDSLNENTAVISSLVNGNDKSQPKS